MTKQVEITNRDGHILRGIVNIPEDGTRFPAIVNVHGFTGNKSGYKSIYTHTARLLAEHGFASVRFDLYGNGESDGEFEDMTFTGILHDIEDIINWTKHKILPIQIRLSYLVRVWEDTQLLLPLLLLILMLSYLCVQVLECGLDVRIVLKPWKLRGSPRPILKDSLSQHLLIMIYLIMSHSRQQKDTTDQSSL